MAKYELTAEEVAEKLGVTVRSIARYCEAGERAKKSRKHDPRSLDCAKELKTDRTGEKWRISQESIELFIRENKIRPVMSRQDSTGLDNVQTSLDRKPEMSSHVQTSPDQSSFMEKVQEKLSFIRSEAAKWKAKWEQEREWKAKEMQERVDAQKQLNSVAFQLGTAQQEIKTLENKMKLLEAGKTFISKGETAEEEIGEIVTTGEAGGLDRTRQDATIDETGLDKTRQEQEPVQTRPDMAEPDPKYAQQRLREGLEHFLNDRHIPLEIAEEIIEEVIEDRGV